MYVTSFPVGRIMGVDLRVHVLLPALLIFALIFSQATTGNVLRGLGLWLALVFAIAVRESARSLAAAYNGLHLKALLIFPVGGVMAFSSEDTDIETATRLLTIVAPLANLIAGLLLLGLSYGMDPHVQLFAQPWISAGHILRSTVWMQFVLGAVSLLPVAALSARQLPMPARKDPDKPPKAVPSLNLGVVIALAMIAASFALLNLWLLLLGGFLFLATRFRAGMPTDAATGSILVSDAMQTDFALVSNSDTLRSALEKQIGSVQEIFPVVRGDRLVGSVSRDALAVQLQTEGDGYLQGLMTRTIALASPVEPLGAALRRSAAMDSGGLIAVVDGGTLLGILTPQGVRLALQRAGSLHGLRNPPDRNREA